MGPPPSQNVLLWIAVFAVFAVVGGTCGVLSWFIKRLLSKFDKRLDDVSKKMEVVREDISAEIDGVDADMERLHEKNADRITRNRHQMLDKFARKSTVASIRSDVRADIRSYKNDLNTRFDQIIGLLKEQN